MSSITIFDHPQLPYLGRALDYAAGRLPLGFVASIAAITISCTSLSAPGNPSISIRTTAQAYVAGQIVEMTLHNVSTEPVNAWLCPELQVRAGGAWQEAQANQLPCLDRLSQVQPGESVKFFEQLGSGLSPGLYRFVLNTVTASGGRKFDLSQRITNEFEIK